MKRLTLLATGLLVLAVASAAIAQEATAPTLTGTVTLRSGQTLSGTIQAADLGIMDGAGIGTNLTDNGAIKVVADGQAQRIPAAEIAMVEVTWQDKSTPEEPRWEITELKVTTRDGKVVTGKPGWYMHATNVSVLLPTGETKRVHAFPLAGPDFSPDNLIAKIEIGEVATAPAEPKPTAPTAPAEPAPTTPTAPAEPAPTAPTAPAEPAPAEPAAPTEPAPAAPTAPAQLPAVQPAPTAPAVTPLPTVIGAPQPIVVTVPVPGTDKKVTVIIYVTVVEGEVKVVPATP